MSNPVGRPRKKLPDSIIQSMYVAGFSEMEISRKLSVGRTTVHRRLISLGVNTRTSVEASDLGRHKTFHMSSTIKSVIDGMMLGDAWIEVDGNSEGRLCLEQTSIHESWIDALEHDLMNSGIQCTRSIRKPRDGQINGNIVRGKGAILLRTRKYQPFTEQRKRWYPDGVKRIPKDVDLSPIALANWYWGDGSTSNHGYRMVFHTDGFDEDEVLFLRDRLHELYGWTPKVNRRSGRDAFILTLGRVEDRKNLVDMIRPFCPPCFGYKMDIKQKALCRVDAVDAEFRMLRSDGFTLAQLNRHFKMSKGWAGWACKRLGI